MHVFNEFRVRTTAQTEFYFQRGSQYAPEQQRARYEGVVEILVLGGEGG